MTDSSPEFVLKYFAALCASMRSMLVSATEYHLQANGQVRKLSKILMKRLRHYIDKHQSIWDQNVQPVVYGYNTRVHCTTGTLTSSLIWSREHTEALSREIEKSWRE